MTKKDLLIEWRKQRKVKISPSEIGQRPLHDSTIDADEYQPSTEPALFENESIICCKHGIKCGEYYNQKFETKKKISSLWPIFELFDRMKIAPGNLTNLKTNENYAKHTINSDQYNRYTMNHYDNISLRCNDRIEKSIKTSNQQQSLLQQKSFYIPKNASKVEIFYRFYLGQKPRSASISLTGIAQNFRLYHEIPENVTNLENLKQYAPLYIVFVNNDLEYKHLPVQEFFVNEKRMFFVECGDRNITPFEKLEHLIRYYANTFAYIDSHGRRSRFPDNLLDSQIYHYK